MSQGGANSSSGSGSPPVETLTGNSGGSVSPTAFNIDILGNNSTGIDIVGTPASSLLTVIGIAASTTQVGTVELATAVESGTLTDSTRAVTPASLEPILVTPYVVAPGGAYTTIQSALDAANAASGGVVVVTPGDYIENLTLYDACHITGMNFSDAGGGVNITGVHTPPLTGGFVFNQVRLISATDVFNSAGAGSAHLVITNTEIFVTNGFTFNLPNWTGKLESFDVNSAVSTNDGYVNNSGGSEVDIFECSVGMGSTNTMNVSGFTLMVGANIYCPVNFATGANGDITSSAFYNSVVLNDNSTLNIIGSLIESGVSAAITMSSSASNTLASCVIDSSNNPAIDGAGAGTLNLVDISYLDNYLVAGTLTLGTTGFTESPLGYNSQSLYVGSRVPSNPYDISIDKSVSGLIGQSIQNTSNNAAAGANLQVIVETAAADAFTYYGVTSTTDWAVGIDNSDSDALKIAAGTTPSGTNTWTMTTAGERTMPLQPAFLASLTSSVSNVTGDGTVYTIIYDTEVFDQNADFNLATSTFTAPVTGRYAFHFECNYNASTVPTSGSLRIATTSATYISTLFPNIVSTANGGNNISIVVPMTATDTAVFQLSLTSGVKDAGVVGTTGGLFRNYVSGYLLV